MAQSAIAPQLVTWFQAEISATEAQNNLTYKLHINEESGKLTVVDLTSTLCGETSGRVECSAPLPSIGNPAIITNNTSQLMATDKATGLASPLSAPFIGNQGCIFRDNLYAVGVRISVSTNKANLNAVLAEFQAAKFKLIRIQGNVSVREECVGYLVAASLAEQLANQEPGDK